MSNAAMGWARLAVWTVAPLLGTLAALTLGASPALASIPTPAAPAVPTVAPCVGDCDLDSRLDVGEVVRCVAMAIGETANPCRRCDVDADGAVAINEVVRAVYALLNGCTHDDAFEPDNSSIRSRDIQCGELQIHDLSLDGDEDWVRPRLPAGQLGILETVDLGRGDWDTILTAYSADGRLVASDDDGGVGQFSQVHFGCTDSTGQITARVVPDAGGLVGTYGIRFTCAACPTMTPTATATPTIAPDRFEPDDTPDAAVPIACGAAQSHTAPAGDIDWLLLALDSRSAVRFHQTSSGGSVGHVLFDDAGEPVVNPYDDQQFECGRNALQAGAYRVRSTASTDTAYDIGVLCEPCDRSDATPTPTLSRPLPTPPTPVATDAYEVDDRERAVRIECGEGLIRSLAPFGDSDWLRLQVAERSAVSIWTVSPIGSPFLALQNGAGADIGFGYAFIHRPCGVTALDAGTYFVEAFEGFSTPYDVLVACTPCTTVGPPTPTYRPRTVTPTPPMADEYEPDDSPDQASDLACGQQQVHSLRTRLDDDWVAVEVAAPSGVTISTSSDLMIDLFDETAGWLIASGVGLLIRPCGESALDPGRYLARMRGTSGLPVSAYSLGLLCQTCTPTPTPTPTPPPSNSPSGSSE